MGELEKWLDEYELWLAEIEIRETPPKRLCRAWFQTAFAPRDNWYPFEEADNE
jgi:hypothetical protein